MVETVFLLHLPDSSLLPGPSPADPVSSPRPVNSRPKCSRSALFPGAAHGMCALPESVLTPPRGRHSWGLIWALTFSFTNLSDGRVSHRLK